MPFSPWSRETSLFSLCVRHSASQTYCILQLLLFVLLQPVEQQADPQLLEARHLLARKQLLLDPENGTLKK